MIGHKKVPSRDGGVEVAVEALSVRMAARGHDVTLYNRGSRTDNMPQKHNKTYKGVHIRAVPVLAYRGMAAFMGSLFATVHALFCGYDCIHYHAEGPAAMAFLPHLFGIRTVVTIHGLDWKRSKWGKFASWYLKQGEKIAVACADEIIVLSRAAKQYFADTYQRETVYIPNGVEPPSPKAPDLIAAQWGLEKDGYILFLGRIVPEKGVLSLITAFKQVKTERKLVIAGDVSDTQHFYTQLRKASDGDDRIVFVGMVYGNVLEELFSNSFLYCLPSGLEGMPISLLEAMRYGNCCLCSDIAECTEVIGSSGYTFRTGDTDDLRAVLQRLCDNPEMVERSRARMSAHSFHRYDWETITDQTLALYQSDGARHRLDESDSGDE